MTVNDKPESNFNPEQDPQNFNPSLPTQQNPYAPMNQQPQPSFVEQPQTEFVQPLQPEDVVQYPAQPSYPPAPQPEVMYPQPVYMDAAVYQPYPQEQFVKPKKSKAWLWILLSILLVIILFIGAIFLNLIPRKVRNFIPFVDKIQSVIRSDDDDRFDDDKDTDKEDEARQNQNRKKNKLTKKDKDAKDQTKESDKKDIKSSEQQEQPNAPASAALVKQFSDSFNALIADYYDADDIYSYALLDVESGSKVNVNGDNQVRAASSIKPFIMAHIYQLVEDGKLDLDKKYAISSSQKVGGSGVIINMNVSELSLYDLVYYMMVESDNTAGNVLIDLAGGLSAVTDYCHSLGCTNTQLGRYFMQTAVPPVTENYTTANDLIELMQKLHAGELINAERSKQMLDIMRQDDADELFSEEIPASHVKDSYAKGGELDRNRSCVNVIVSDIGTYIVAGMVDQDNVEDIKEDMRDIGEDVYELYARTVKR